MFNEQVPAAFKHVVQKGHNCAIKMQSKYVWCERDVCVFKNILSEKHTKKEGDLWYYIMCDRLQLKYIVNKNYLYQIWIKNLWNIINMVKKMH